MNRHVDNNGFLVYETTKEDIELAKKKFNETFIGKRIGEQMLKDFYIEIKKLYEKVAELENRKDLDDFSRDHMIAIKELIENMIREY